MKTNILAGIAYFLILSAFAYGISMCPGPDDCSMLSSFLITYAMGGFFLLVGWAMNRWS